MRHFEKGSNEKRISFGVFYTSRMGSSLLHFVVCLSRNVKNLWIPDRVSPWDIILWLDDLDAKIFSERTFDWLFFLGFSLTFSHYDHSQPTLVGLKSPSLCFKP